MTLDDRIRKFYGEGRYAKVNKANPKAYKRAKGLPKVGSRSILTKEVKRGRGKGQD